MNKPYTFLQDTYQDLESLSKAYTANFNEGMEDIYSNTKELFRFIKSRINDKALLRKYTAILEETKYKSNALTFLIFEMSGHKSIIIAGRELDLLSYLQALRENPDPADNILFGFLEDGGISKTYAVAGADPKLCAHSAAIEKNFRNPFTYTYLTAYYGYEMKESLNAKVRNIAINGEECFRRFSNLAGSEAFQIALAHKVGFTDTIAAVTDISPVFRSLKLLKGETEEEFLRKIVDRTYFWWMLADDNFMKYEYKGKAQKILRKYNELKKENDHFQSMIEQKKISFVSFDRYIDMSEELFRNYLSFVAAYHDNQIEVKKKYDPEKYAPDKAYNHTYICQEFMAGKICRLYEPGHGTDSRLNPLTGEIVETEEVVDLLDDVSRDAPVLAVPEEAEKMPDPKKVMKSLNNTKLFFAGAMLFGFLSLIVLLGMVVLVKFLPEGRAVRYRTNFSYLAEGYTLYAIAGCMVVLFLVSALALNFVKKSRTALRKYSHMVSDLEPKDFLEEELILFKEEKKKEEKQAFKSYSLLSCIAEITLGVLVTIVSYFFVAALCAFRPAIGNFSDAMYGYGVYVPFAISAVLGLICGMIFQKKSPLKLALFIVLCLGVTILVMLSM